MLAWVQILLLLGSCKALLFHLDVRYLLIFDDTMTKMKAVTTFFFFCPLMFRFSLNLRLHVLILGGICKIDPCCKYGHRAIDWF